MKENPLITQFLGKTAHSAAELQQQLSRYKDSKVLPIADLQTVLELLAKDPRAPNYQFSVHDMSGTFERQAYLLRVIRQRGEWSFDHVVVFSILAHCARLEPQLFEKKLAFDCLLHEVINLPFSH